MEKGFYEFDGVYIKAEASTVGKKEYEGPLGQRFDSRDDDEYFGCKTFEDAETEMIRRNLNILCTKAGCDLNEADALFAGDLLNQCVASSFAASGAGLPYFGLYGACSTIAEALLCASVFIDSDKIKSAVCYASSHFCTSERQYRFPLEYGSTRTPTSQNTVTGTGAFFLTNEKTPLRIECAVAGMIVDRSVKDANNMGAAMASAAADTIERFFKAGKYAPDDLDLVITGDLGIEGHSITAELLRKKRIDLGGRYTDCGRIIYDKEKQDTHSGGSGAGCMSSVLAGHFLKLMRDGELKRILAVGTGALLNVNSVLQKKTIPAIAHSVCISSEV